MTRRERTMQKVQRLEIRACAAVVKATNARDALGWPAHQAGLRAEKAWAKARQLVMALEYREEAAEREKKAKKKPMDFLRGGAPNSKRRSAGR
jgi:hypothetical protein